MSTRASEWLRYTLSALAGAVAVIVTVSIAWADVRRNASEGAALAPRVSAVEHRLSGDTEWRKALDLRLDRFERKLDQMLDLPSPPR